MAKQVINSSRYLPTELLIDIFLRLPVKTLIRCTAVSKSWYDHIRNSNFIASHLNYNDNYRPKHSDNGYILFGGPDFCHVVCDRTFKLLYNIETPIPVCPDLKSSLNFVGSCNGLVCLSLGSGTKLVNDVYIWNPSIRTLKKLPPSQFPGEFRDYKSLVCRLGFGFHELTNDYKVIKLVYFRRGNDFTSVHTAPWVEVYSLRTESWNVVHTEGSPILIIGVVTFHKGVFYWFGCQSPYNVPMETYIMSFDLDDEKLREIEQPLEESRYHVVEMKGSPGSLYAIYSNSNFCECDILVLWKMDECNRSWMKAYTIKCNRGFALPILGFTTSGKFVFVNRENKLVSFDLESLQTEVHDLGIPIITSAVDVNYMESLLLFDH